MAPVVWRYAVCLVMLLTLASGCHETATSSERATGGAVQPEEEEAPITAADVPVPGSYAEAVQRLEQYRDQVKQAISSGKLHDAHRPLDETNIALERLPGIARSSDVPRSEWEAIVVAGDDLAEALGAIHEAIDAGQSPDYAAQAGAIDDALRRLRAVSGAQGAENHKPAGDQP
jgi:hypothetical protein